MSARERSFPGLRVLVVEDEAFIAMDLEQMLHELGCEIIATASTVDGALAHVRRGGIDGALLDSNLHGVSILPVAEELTAAATPFILLTGYSRRESDPPLLREARRVSKPFSLSSLSAAIEENAAPLSSGAATPWLIQGHSCGPRPHCDHPLAHGLGKVARPSSAASQPDTTAAPTHS